MEGIEKATAILVGGRWMAVSEGTTCHDEVRFTVAPYTSMVVKRSAVDAYKVITRPDVQNVERFNPWEAQ